MTESKIYLNQHRSVHTIITRKGDHTNPKVILQVKPKFKRSLKTLAYYLRLLNGVLFYSTRKMHFAFFSSSALLHCCLKRFPLQVRHALGCLWCLYLFTSVCLSVSMSLNPSCISALRHTDRTRAEEPSQRVGEDEGGHAQSAAQNGYDERHI